MEKLRINRQSTRQCNCTNGLQSTVPKTAQSWRNGALQNRQAIRSEHHAARAIVAQEHKARETEAGLLRRGDQGRSRGHTGRSAVVGAEKEQCIGGSGRVEQWWCRADAISRQPQQGVQCTKREWHWLRPDPADEPGLPPGEGDRRLRAHQGEGREDPTECIVRGSGGPPGAGVRGVQRVGQAPDREPRADGDPAPAKQEATGDRGQGEDGAIAGE